MVKNSYLKLLFVLLTLISVPAFAQTANDETEAVKKTINDLFLGMKKGDTALIRSAFSKNAIMQTIAKNKEGMVRVMTEPVDSFLASVARPHTEVYDERIEFNAIKTDGELALVWTPYKFYIGDKFSHCGVNSFQLVKIGGEWKIQYIIDTRRRQNCD
jgi:hypothetical protein